MGSSRPRITFLIPGILASSMEYCRGALARATWMKPLGSVDLGRAMDRNSLARIFYGDGPVPAVWATDCPVRFDVWNAFAKPTPPGSHGRVDVILAINE